MYHEDGLRRDYDWRGNNYSQDSGEKTSEMNGQEIGIVINCNRDRGQKTTSHKWWFLAAAAVLHLVLLNFEFESTTRSQCSAPHRSAKHLLWLWIGSCVSITKRIHRNLTFISTIANSQSKSRHKGTSKNWLPQWYDESQEIVHILPFYAKPETNNKDNQC